MALTTDELLAKKIGSFRQDPLGYVMFVFPWGDENGEGGDPSIQKVLLPEEYRERFKSKWGPDKWACDFLDDLGNEIKKRGFDGTRAVDPIRFSTSSGHGIGKSTLVAWLIKFISDTRPFSKGMVTANTSDQLRTKTWAELAKWHGISITAHWWTLTAGRGSLSLYRNGSKRVQQNWRVDGLTCREENAEAFQGLHAADSTAYYIFDEASGIPDPIWDAREGGGTDGEPMSFDFGNPTRKSGRFFENCIGRFRHRFNVRQIDSRQVQITNKALMKQWADDWGEDSDFFKVRVKGEFPATGSVQFIGTDFVMDAMARPGVIDKSKPLVIGVDVARFGDNDTIIYPRIGFDAKSFPFRRYKGLDTVQVVEKIIETLQEFQSIGRRCQGLFIDGGGLGGGVVDMLRRLGHDPIDVNFGGAAADRKYRYRVDEMWGRMRDDMDRLCLPRDQDLLDQLTQREYGFTLAGRIQLESKKDMAERGIQSPDIADALALTYASTPAMTLNPNLDHLSPVFAQHEYDPFDGLGV